MAEPVRDEKGMWKTSGNPGGRPKGVLWFRAACRKRTRKALRALEAALLRDEHAVAAAKVILEFAWGKASSVAAAPDEPADQISDAQADELEKRLDS